MRIEILTKQLNAFFWGFLRYIQKTSLTVKHLTFFMRHFQGFAIQWVNWIANFLRYIGDKDTLNFPYQFENRIFRLYKKIKKFNFFLKDLNQKSGPDKILVFC